MGAVVLAFVIVAVFLALVGKSPLRVYGGIAAGAFASWPAFTETLVAATPVMICGLAVSITARVGLTNIGAEGQLHMGAVGATYVAVAMANAPRWQVLPCMIAAACTAGAIWAGVPGLLRVYLRVNETIVTLLLNYVAILIVDFVLHGSLQDPTSFSWPQSPQLSHAAELPHLGSTRLHAGLLFGLTIAGACAIILWTTRIGFVARLIGANPRAAANAHHPVAQYLVAAMFLSGAVAAISGLTQVSAIEGRLRAGMSPGYGFSGFLVSWLARHNPIAIVVVAIFVGGLRAGTDSLQITEELPSAMINILQGCIFLLLLCFEHPLRKLSPAPTRQEAR
jgi:simple sugar transport system permease protein